jgi:3-O-alpha-D-mannopyranosyl-alpha-D-mannopyranose xylosylphosphotransferase
MMDEVGIMFATDLALAGTRGFRESKRGEGDLEMAALATWLRVERWREALLWTWVVGKQGPVWGDEARNEIRTMFGDGLQEGKTVLFRKGRRTTLKDIKQTGDQPLETRYKFCESHSTPSESPLHQGSNW